MLTISGSSSRTTRANSSRRPHFASSRRVLSLPIPSRTGRRARTRPRFGPHLPGKWSASLSASQVCNTFLFENSRRIVVLVSVFARPLNVVTGDHWNPSSKQPASEPASAAEQIYCGNRERQWLRLSGVRRHTSKDAPLCQKEIRRASAPTQANADNFPLQSPYRKAFSSPRRKYRGRQRTAASKTPRTVRRAGGLRIS